VPEDRSGIYDVSAVDQDKAIAEFRGHSRQIPGAFFPELPNPHE
jgi:hypothetical protein